ncbi:hypothetical protein [Aquimarina sp. SS2-1]|uniref:hypothetical protein n=1 Tax=Aquimarina besae TaxID=3342247 RepID=UPI003672F156
MPRHDLTDWIIHFVHDRNPENDPLEFSLHPETFEYLPFPDNFDFEGEPIYQIDESEESDYGLESDATAFSVLMKILHDGYVRAGWSFRKMNPTIYGPKSAVCFTEMPLYGLIEYANIRNAKNLTQQYGIAFMREELFAAGARPVIYGLSGKHQEAKESDEYFGKGLRNLASNCGIGLKEQYRYVYTNIGTKRKIDWTHEREWRWADLDDEFYFPGMPFYAQNDTVKFSKIVVLVKTAEEVEQVIDQLQNLYHSKGTNYGREYDLELIRKTYVLALDELKSFTPNDELIKIEDLPINTIPKIEKITVSKEMLEKVRTVINKASEICYNKTGEYAKKHGDSYPCGRANLICWDSNSEITQALIDLEFAHTYADGYYHIYLPTGYPVQSLDAHEYGIKFALEYVKTELGDGFSSRSRWD